MSDPANSSELIYLDNSATSYPKPESVVTAVRDSIGQCLTVARSTHRTGFRADEMLRQTRISLAQFLNAASPEEVVFTYSATDGLNISLNGLIKPGGHVIVSPLEHHSVMRPLHHMKSTYGTSWSEIPADSMGAVDPASIRSLVRPDTCCIVINWVSNVSGTMQPVVQIGEVAAELGLPYVIDAAQGTGTHPADVQKFRCTAMAQPGHKALMSMPGTGVLYVNSRYTLTPWRIGGTGYRSDLVEQPEETPMRYESGTANVPGIVGLNAAVDWIEQTGLEAIGNHCCEMTTRLIEGLSEIQGVSVIGPPAGPDRGFLVSFTLDGVDPLVVSEILAERFNITSRAGLHCAPTAHHYFGTYELGGTVRLSVSAFTTPEHVEFALSSVAEIARELI